MATNKYEDFFPMVLPECPGVPGPVAINAIVTATIDFCTKSRAYRVDLDPMSISAGSADYDIEAPAQTLPVDVTKCWYIPTGELILPATEDKLDEISPGWRLAQDNRPQRYLIKNRGRTISFVPIPSESQSSVIGLKVAVRPTLAATTIDADFFEDYMEKIAPGAKSTLMLMKNKQWSDEKQAAIYAAQFEAAATEARRRAAREFSRGPLTARAQPFGGV